MKNKNTVIALLIVFSVICIYQLYWTYIQFDEDGKRQEYSTILSQSAKDSSKVDSGDLEIAREYMDDADNKERYDKAIDRSFTLGLDLQGGMFVTMEVDLEDLMRQLAGSSRNDASFVAGLANASKAAQTDDRPFVDIFLDELYKVDADANIGAIFSNRSRNISNNTPRAEVEQLLRTESEDAIDRTFEIVRKRIDQFGVSSPNLQKQAGTGRLLLELPGVREPERVRKLLRNTARLDFWETYTVSEIYENGGGILADIDTRLKGILGYADSTDTDTTAAPAVDPELADIAENDTSNLDQIGAADGETIDSTTTLDDQTNLTDADSTAGEDLTFEERRRRNPLFALLGPPSGNIQANSPVVGYARYTDTAAINEHFRRDEIQEMIPDRMRFVWSFKPLESNKDVFMLIALKPNSQDSSSLDGSVVTNATQDFDERGNPSVTLAMNTSGGAEWGRITEQNIQRAIAVTLDGAAYTWPNINEKIPGGRSSISGSFTIDEAKDLATVLKAGQLPVRTRIESEDQVGPTLGQENIDSGFIAFIMAIILTLIFMAIYYAKAGLVADVALVANIFFVLGCFASFTVVLTLPGIAALVLTVGMAVDANVLIFERVREEQAKGKTLKASIKSGFSNAFSSVMDANITTFLTGVVLYAFGVGPIRGFAVALMIGIVTSLISALIITRLILDYYANKGGSSIAFGSSSTTGLFDRLKLNMVGRRKKFYTLSAVLVGISILSMIVFGFKTGVDFKGGRQFVVAFSDTSGEAANLSSSEVQDLRETLDDAFKNTDTQVKTMSSNNQLMITTSYLSEQTGNLEGTETSITEHVISLLEGGIKSKYPNYESKWIQSSSMVGPTLADDIRDAALYAIVFSLLIIFLYILIRFRKWQYSAGAIAALFHDVLIVLGVFSLLSMVDPSFFNVEINQAIIAALLTIIGYSINDTVVVFDRIRENIGEMKASSLEDVYNTSIDQTLSRTLITSVTTLITALILFFFGGEGIRGFTFGIVIGIMVGTYSSIFVASPISLDLIKRYLPKGKAQTAN
ncbi:MAG: protein translocase subunit SecDF [Bacteroidia bacterium]